MTRRGNLYDNIDQTNAAGFLFRDDDSTVDSATYSAVKAGIAEDSFPQLYAQKGNPNVVSSSGEFSYLSHDTKDVSQCLQSEISFSGLLIS